ncbi:MAG TPA: polysaccharide deacetylase family protein [Acidimicrobiales bacterium]|nr:polysaccharide deacetylase family protein [Acidimicrobiales bacterium]
MPRHRVPARLTAVVIGASALAACTTPVHSDPANVPNAVVSSLDRIRDAQARFGGPGACLEDAYCAAGITRVYGMQFASGTIAFGTPGATVGALAAGAIDIGALPATAVEASDPRVTVLRDDLTMQPADNVVPVVSARSSSAALADAVDSISATLDTAGLQAIDRAVAGGSAPEVAASDWLGHHPALDPVPPPAGTPALVVGARPDAESTALADLYAAALARMGWATTVAPVVNRWQELQALGSGHVGLVPDLTADLLQVVTGYTGGASNDQFRNLVLLRSALADLGLLAYEPAPAISGDTFVVASAVASSLSLTTLSDLARAAGAHPAAPPPPPALTKAELATDTEGPARPVRPTLGVGSTGGLVESVQARLTSLGYAATATGTYDEGTRRAVAAFQADAGLVTTGALDPATARALMSAKAARSSGHLAPFPGDVNSVRPPSANSTVYLLFAGAPSNGTVAIINALAQVGGQATFFVEESAVASEPETLRQIRAAGDAVGITAWPHNGASPIAADALTRTISATQVAVSSVDGVTPTCLLPPYGSSDPASRARATSLGMHVVLWDVDPQDWRQPGAAAVAQDVINSVRPGSLVLLHDDGAEGGQTVVALGQVLQTLRTIGYSFSAVPGC